MKRTREKRDGRLTIYFAEKEIEKIWEHIESLDERPTMSDFIRRTILKAVKSVG